MIQATPVSREGEYILVMIRSFLCLHDFMIVWKQLVIMFLLQSDRNRMERNFYICNVHIVIVVAVNVNKDKTKTEEGNTLPSYRIF